MSYLDKANRVGKLMCASLFTCLLVACVQQVPVKEFTTSATFYPPLPNPPRIQHLTSISGERDLGAKLSGFEQFIVGEDPKSQQLKQPYGIALFEGKLYVADSRAPGLAVFDLVRQTYNLVTGAGNGRMRRPINVRIDNDGTKYVTDTGLNQILVFDRMDRFVTAFGESGQFKPVDAVISGDRLYVADIDHHQIQVLEKRTGRLLFKFGKAGSSVGELYHPTNLAVGLNGDIYVVETSNYRVQRFTPDGVHVRSYGAVGTQPGSFARPKGIAIDRQGQMYVADAAFENVQMFDAYGRLLLYFGQPDGNGGLHLPTGVAIDYDNVAFFRRFADPKFNIEYLILTASQFGPNRIDVFAFGKMQGMNYPIDAPPAPQKTELKSTLTASPVPAPASASAAAR